MSSSSAPLEPAAELASTAPTGWTGDTEDLYKEYYWAGSRGDLKDVLKTRYILDKSSPIWARLSIYGEVQFIFSAVPKSGKTTYYVWNGIENRVLHIEAQGLDEIRNTINKFGEGKGYLGDLKLTPHLIARMSLDNLTNPPLANDSEGRVPLTPPEGWTDDPEDMELDYCWQGRDGDLKETLETNYKLSDAQPLLARESDSGEVLFLVQSGHGKNSKYYIWNGIESVLCLIKSPVSLEDIYKSIGEEGGYLGGLELISAAKSRKE